MPTGTVIDFDEAKGWGHVSGADGVTSFFHCTAIVDGTRTIEVGTDVRYDIVPGRLGRWEATAVQPRGAG
jgi:CspA family cold shock protein